jgi:ABC-type Fe3+ transport system substrate-binding protein
MTESSDTLSQVIDRLKTQGYTEDLNRPENNTLWLDPDDESILYALYSDYYNVKGILVNGYGLSADPATAAIEKRLHRVGAD